MERFLVRRRGEEEIMPKNQKLLLALCAIIAGIGLVGLVLNLRALNSRNTARVESSMPGTSEPVASENLASPGVPSVNSSSEPSQKKVAFSRESLSQLLEQAKQESQICKANIASAKAKLSKVLMSHEEFKEGLKLLEDSALTPPALQEIFSAIDEGIPSEWRSPSLLEDAYSSNGCLADIHYKLLKSVVEKAARSPDRFPKDAILSSVQAFLIRGAEKPSPLLIDVLRISMLKVLVNSKDIDASFGARVAELDALANELIGKLQEETRQCRHVPDCLKSLPLELEFSKRVRNQYLSLIKEIWPDK